MSELGDMFSAYKADKKIKKESNKINSKQLLINSGVKFDEKNDGIHLIIHAPEGFIDFWPSTGKWTDRNNGITRRGIFRLLRFIGIKKENYESK